MASGWASGYPATAMPNQSPYSCLKVSAFSTICLHALRIWNSHVLIWLHAASRQCIQKPAYCLVQYKHFGHEGPDGKSTRTDRFHSRRKECHLIYFTRSSAQEKPPSMALNSPSPFGGSPLSARMFWMPAAFAYSSLLLVRYWVSAACFIVVRFGFLCCKTWRDHADPPAYAFRNRRSTSKLLPSYRPS